MKKVIVIICLALSGLIILDSMQAGSAIVAFFLVGAIPGTKIVISASHALELFAVAGGFVLARITNNLTLQFLERLQSKQAI